MAGEKFYEFLLAAFQNMESVMAADASIYVFHADTEGLNFRRAFADAGFYLSGCCIWKKQSLVLGRSPYQWQHEPVLYGWKKNGKHQWYTGRKETTIWGVRQTQEERRPSHHEADPRCWLIPSATPVWQTRWCWIPSAAPVLPSLPVSRPTASAEPIELDEKFCDVIVNRYIEQVGSADGVSVLRDGKTYSYEEVADGTE